MIPLYGIGWSLRSYVQRLRSAADPNTRVLMLSLLMPVLALLADACLSGNFVMPLPQLWICVALGLAWGAYRDAGAARSPALAASNPSPTAQPLLMALRWLLCLGLLGLLAVSLLEFSQPEVHLIESRWVGKAGEEEFSPRFWRRGWF